MNPKLLRLLAWLGVLNREQLRIPLIGPPLRFDAYLFVEMTSGKRTQMRFRVDSGCSRTTIGTGLAGILGLPVSGPRERISRTSAAGTIVSDVVRGQIRFWLTEKQVAAPFILPVNFVDPDPPANVPPLLGLQGMFGQLRWLIDGEDDENGFCVLTDRRSASQRFPS